MLRRFSHKSVVLLQGPLGPFFWRFAKDLVSVKARVTKINFCGGDRIFFCGKNTVNYRDTLYNWPIFFKELIRKKEVDAVFLLGDCRPYHRRACDVVRELGVELYCFEEGYLRPDFITLERDGVNGNSKMSDRSDFYRKANLAPREDNAPVGKTFRPSAWYAIIYYVANALTFWKYRHYVHHRDTGMLHHGLAWVRGYFRKLLYNFKERRFMNELIGKWSGKYFLFPLQVHNDYQFKHARFERIEDCIEEVFESFGNNAKEDEMLVLKHHPADRPYKDYTRLIRSLAVRYHMEERVLYVHDQHLPTLVRHARGTVVMNSTVGLTSVHYKTPVIVLGRAVYKIPGLTYKGNLDDFWGEPGIVDMKLYRSFRGWLEHNNQFNGSFYRRLPGTGYASGVRWEKENEQ